MNNKQTIESNNKRLENLKTVINDLPEGGGTSTIGSYTWVQCEILDYIDSNNYNIGNIVNYVTSTEEDTYPDEGVKDGYYYKKYSIATNKSCTNFTHTNISAGEVNSPLILYHNNIYVTYAGASSDTQYLYYSTDGVNFTKNTSLTNYDVQDLAWVEDRFYTILSSTQENVYGSSLYTSTDGINWTLCTFSSSYTYFIPNVKFNDKYICVNGGGKKSKLSSYNSDDGINFTFNSYVGSNSGSDCFITKFKDKLVVAANNYWCYTTDGVNWVDTSKYCRSSGGIVYDENIIFFPNIDNEYSYTTDGVNFTDTSISSSGNRLHKAGDYWYRTVLSTNSTVSKTIYYSIDGINNWTATNASLAYANIIHTKNIYLIYCDDVSTIYKSTDGKTFTAINLTNIIEPSYDKELTRIDYDYELITIYINFYYSSSYSIIWGLTTLDGENFNLFYKWESNTSGTATTTGPTLKGKLTYLNRKYYIIADNYLSYATYTYSLINI